MGCNLSWYHSSLWLLGLKAHLHDLAKILLKIDFDQQAKGLYRNHVLFLFKAIPTSSELMIAVEPSLL